MDPHARPAGTTRPPARFLEDATWISIGAAPLSRTPSAFVVRRRMILSRRPDTAVLTAAAHGPHQVFVNGTWAGGTGTDAGTTVPDVYQYDITALLAPDLNEMLLVVGRHRGDSDGTPAASVLGPRSAQPHQRQRQDRHRHRTRLAGSAPTSGRPDEHPADRPRSLDGGRPGRRPDCGQPAPPPLVAAVRTTVGLRPVPAVRVRRRQT
ncbi:hypothetical protein ABZS66_26495 [Dactylosporangium sp. NPDC005572]|uniref:hypothetical protein n=1 Tax=Dactylosporangium sp. NPDC005572 TaxID=3156889 RepID=UPI0033BE2B06